MLSVFGKKSEIHTHTFRWNSWCCQNDNTVHDKQTSFKETVDKRCTFKVVEPTYERPRIRKKIEAKVWTKEISIYKFNAEKWDKILFRRKEQCKYSERITPKNKIFISFFCIELVYNQRCSNVSYINLFFSLRLSHTNLHF